MFSDWVFNKSDPDMVANIAVGAPLQGSGSLRVSNCLEQSVAAALNCHLVATRPRGFRRGRLRTLIRLAAGSNRCMAGLLCLQSALDLTAAGTSCYLVQLAVDASGATRTIDLVKVADGLLESPWPSALASVASPAFSLATTYGLELEWDATDPDAGTSLSVRLGTQTDFSDLAEILSTSDTSSPLSSGTAEGAFLKKFDVQNDLAEALIDNTSILRLA